MGYVFYFYPGLLIFDWVIEIMSFTLLDAAFSFQLFLGFLLCVVKLRGISSILSKITFKVC